MIDNAPEEILPKNGRVQAQ